MSCTHSFTWWCECTFLRISRCIQLKCKIRILTEKSWKVLPIQNPSIITAFRYRFIKVSLMYLKQSYLNSAVKWCPSFQPLCPLSLNYAKHTRSREKMNTKSLQPFRTRGLSPTTTRLRLDQTLVAVPFDHCVTLDLQIYLRSFLT